MNNAFEFFTISRLVSARSEMGLLRCGVLPRQQGVERDFLTTEYALLCSLEGEGTYIDARQREFAFKKGSILQRFPGERHTIVWREAGATAHIAVPAETRALLKLGGGASSALDAPVFDSPVSIKTFYQECRAIYRALQETPRSRYIDIINRAQRFFSTLLCSPDELKRDSLVHMVGALLAESPARRYSISQLSRRAHMSPSAFRAKFTEEADISPGAFMVRERIEYAKRLLLENQRSVGDIAAALSYPDIYAFSRQFKKHTGQSPTRYRANPKEA